MGELNEILLKLLDEIVGIKELLVLSLRDEIKNELNSIATTEDRQKIWALCDGLTSTADIAKKVGVSQRAVQLFISQLEERDLIITEQWGRPKRRVDYIPSEWRISEVSRIG